MGSEPRQGEPPFLLSRLNEDPELLREVEAAERLGISLKRFRGWEPTTTVQYAYAAEPEYGFHDHTARREPTGYTSTPDVEWDEDQQGWMLALGLHKASRCPGCGGNLAETTDAKNEDRYRHEVPLQCQRCVAFARGAEAYADQPRPNTFIHLVPQKPKR